MTASASGSSVQAAGGTCSWTSYPQRADEAVSKRKAAWQIHHDHRALLDRKDIDGVIVATADHQRVLCSIHACQAGKDVYAEKPLTLYIAEGRALVKAARRHNR